MMKSYLEIMFIMIIDKKFTKLSGKTILKDKTFPSMHKEKRFRRML